MYALLNKENPNCNTKTESIQNAIIGEATSSKTSKLKITLDLTLTANNWRNYV